MIFYPILARIKYYVEKYIRSFDTYTIIEFKYLNDF